MCEAYKPIVKQRNNIINWPKKMNKSPDYISDSNKQLFRSHNYRSDDKERFSEEDTRNTENSENSEDMDSASNDRSTPNDQTTPKNKKRTKNKTSETIISSTSKDTNTEDTHGKSRLYSLSVVVLMLGVGLGLGLDLYLDLGYYFTSDTEVMTNNRNVEEMFEDSKALFPEQHEKTWFTFIVGVNTTVNSDQPAVFLLLHDDSVTANCIVSHVSRKVQKIFKLSEKPLQLVAAKEVEKFDKDRKEITRYLSEVEKRTIVEIHDFEEFPGEIAKHFHSFCDVYNPMVKKAVYFFIMKTNDKNTNNLNLRARHTMENLWNKSLSDNELDPLITRLSENVIDILPEHGVSSC